MFTAGFLLGRGSASGDITVSAGLDLSRPASVQIQDDVSVSGPDKEEAEEEKININTADADLLTQLPGIGEVLAQRIIDYLNQNGPFADISDIMDVSGIGPSVFEKIKDIIVLEG